METVTFVIDIEIREVDPEPYDCGCTENCPASCPCDCHYGSGSDNDYDDEDEYD